MYIASLVQTDVVLFQSGHSPNYMEYSFKDQILLGCYAVLGK
jgi:hypothetical protein